MKKTIIFLLFVFSQTAFCEKKLAGGVTLNNQNFLIFSEKDSVFLTDLELKKTISFNNVIAFDFENEQLLVIVNNSRTLILNNNMEINEIEMNTINPLLTFHKHIVHADLISEQTILIPEKIPYLYFNQTHLTCHLPDLYYLEGMNIRLYKMSRSSHSQNHIAVLNNKSLSIINTVNAEIINTSFQDHIEISSFKIKDNIIDLVFDKKWLKQFNVKNGKTLTIKRIEKKDFIQTNFNFGTGSDDFTIKVEPVSTSIFSVLSDWKKGESTASITILNKENILFEKNVPFTMLEMDSFKVEIYSKGKYLIIAIPNMVHILRLIDKEFRLSSLNSDTELALLSDLCFVELNNQLTEIDKVHPAIKY